MVTHRALVYCAGGGIGDSLIASLVARALHQRYAHVSALTLPGHRALLERVPDFDDVFVDDGGDERALAAKISELKYDACVVTWATSRTARIPYLAKIPTRVGQARRLYSWRFTKRVIVRSEFGDAISHWSDILLDYARALGCDLPVSPASERIPRFVCTGEDEGEVQALRRSLDYAPLRDASLGMTSLGVTSGFILVHPTNAVAVKRGIWPASGWAALARSLRERYNATVLITGTDADRPIVDAILRQAQDGTNLLDGDVGQERAIISIAGRLGIGGFGVLAKQARLVVGMGTGTLHVAAAVGAPTVALFPMQSDFPERWRPLGEHVQVVRASYPCHPGDTKETCADYACIRQLPIDAILTAASELSMLGLA